MLSNADISHSLVNATHPVCHCEERSDEAIHLEFQLDCRARLRRTRNDKQGFEISGLTRFQNESDRIEQSAPQTTPRLM
jgi:hypothetical protein